MCVYKGAEKHGKPRNTPLETAVYKYRNNGLEKDLKNTQGD